MEKKSSFLWLSLIISLEISLIISLTVGKFSENSDSCEKKKRKTKIMIPEKGAIFQNESKYLRDTSCGLFH